MALFSVSADYKDLKPWAKLGVSGLVILMPIMFLAIFILKRPYFDAVPIYINIIWAYALTIPVFAITSFWSWMFVDTTKVPHEFSLYYGIGLAFIYMLSCTFLGWKNKWDFYFFYKIVLACSVSFFVIGYIFDIIKGVIKGVREIK